MANRFWVNGTGNWSDYSPGHWATTSGGDPVAGSLGNDMVLNGSFTGNADNWTLGTGWTYGDNKVSHATGGANNYTYLEQNIAAEAGELYSISFDLIVVAKGVYVNFGGSETSTINTTGSHNIVIRAYNTNTLKIRDWVGFVGSIDNVVVKKLTSLIPSPSDNVIIDANSGLGGGTMTIDTRSATCYDFTSSVGSPYLVDMPVLGLSVFGSLTYENGITGANDTSFYFYGKGSHTIDFGGNTTGISYITIEDYEVGDGGTYTLLSDVVILEDLYMDNKTLNLNGFNWKSNVFEVDSYDAEYQPTIYLGSGTLWTKFFDIYSTPDYPIVMNGGTGLIKISNISETSTPPYISPSGFTYNNVWITEMGSTGNAVLIEGYYDDDSVDVGTFNEMKIEPGISVLIKGGNTVHVSSFIANGTAIQPIVLNSWSVAGQFTLSKPSGTVTCDYLDLSNSNATGGAYWSAGSHSLDTTNNDGWVFPIFSNANKNDETVTNTNKHASSATNTDKNSASATNLNKTAITWANLNKNSATATNSNKS